MVYHAKSSLTHFSPITRINIIANLFRTQPIGSDLPLYTDDVSYDLRHQKSMLANAVF